MSTIIPVPSPGVYDSWNTILNSARMRLHSRMPSLQTYSGNILDASQAETLQACRNAARVISNKMRDSGSTRFENDFVLFGLPPTTNMDPASTCTLDWFGYFDGNNLFQPIPALPSDLLLPLWMSERQSGTNLPFPPPNRPNMNPQIDGLPKRPKLIFNGCWQWKNNQVNIPGALQTIDLWIYYRSRIPDPKDIGQQRWFDTDCQIAVECQDALVWWICAEFATSLAASATDPMVAQNAIQFVSTCESKGAEATRLFVNQDKMLKARADVRRRPYGSGARGGGGLGGWK